MNIPISSRRDRSHYTLSDALDEIALAEAILDGMKAKPGVTPMGANCVNQRSLETALRDVERAGKLRGDGRHASKPKD